MVLWGTKSSSSMDFKNLFEHIWMYLLKSHELKCFSGIFGGWGSDVCYKSCSSGPLFVGVTEMTPLFSSPAVCDGTELCHVLHRRCPHVCLLLSARGVCPQQILHQLQHVTVRHSIGGLRTTHSTGVFIKLIVSLFLLFLYNMCKYVYNTVYTGLDWPLGIHT